jgi:hypothetical protein
VGEVLLFDDKFTLRGRQEQPAPIVGVAFSSGGTRLLTVGPGKSNLGEWRTLKTADLTEDATGRAPLPSSPSRLAVAPAEDVVALVGRTGQVAVGPATDLGGQGVWRLDGKGLDAALSPDKQRLFVLHEDGTILLLDRRTQAPVFALHVPTGQAGRIALSADGTCLAWTGGLRGEVRIWRAAP